MVSETSSQTPARSSVDTPAHKSTYSCATTPNITAPLPLCKVNYVYPAVRKGWALAVKIHSTTEVELINAAYGLATAFFGGYFAVTIAAIEAAKMCGWESTLKVQLSTLAEC